MLGQNTAIGADGSRPVIRIAIPDWPGRGRRRRTQAATEPTLEDFKRALDSALSPNELIGQPMSRSERRQVAITRKLRMALYGSPDPA